MTVLRGFAWASSLSERKSWTRIFRINADIWLRNCPQSAFIWVHPRTNSWFFSLSDKLLAGVLAAKEVARIQPHDAGYKIKVRIGRDHRRQPVILHHRNMDDVPGTET
jgi:hypothetical protein